MTGALGGVRLPSPHRPRGSRPRGGLRPFGLGGRPVEAQLRRARERKAVRAERAGRRLGRHAEAREGERGLLSAPRARNRVGDVRELRIDVPGRQARPRARHVHGHRLGTRERERHRRRVADVRAARVDAHLHRRVRAKLHGGEADRPADLVRPGPEREPRPFRAGHEKRHVDAGRLRVPVTRLEGGTGHRDVVGARLGRGMAQDGRGLRRGMQHPRAGGHHHVQLPLFGNLRLRDVAQRHRVGLALQGRAHELPARARVGVQRRIRPLRERQRLPGSVGGDRHQGHQADQHPTQLAHIHHHPWLTE